MSVGLVSAHCVQMISKCVLIFYDKILLLHRERPYRPIESTNAVSEIEVDLQKFLILMAASDEKWKTRLEKAFFININSNDRSIYIVRRYRGA